MIKNINYILLAVILVIMTTACSSDKDDVVDIVVPNAEEVRLTKELSVTVSLGDEAKTKVAFTPKDNGLSLSWKENERLGVYIQKTDGTVFRAGYMTSKGEATTGVRHFTGSAMMLESGEKYLYMHPDLNERNSIDFTHQMGALSNTDHLDDLVPLIWIGTGNPEEILYGETRGYVIHVKMQFKENPGTIRRVKMCTMKRGNEDRIFPKAFDVRRMGAEVNNSVASGTQGTGLSEDNNYTDNITLTVEGIATEVGTGAERHWEADAYMVCASVKNLNVFNTKYHVTADCDGGLFTCSDYLSFPGQDKEPASSSRTLAMLSDGKIYNLNVKLSKDVCNTIISSSYGISSILGMWDSNGVSYDPCGLKCTDEQLPNHLKDNKANIISCNNSNRYSDLTALYKTHNVGFVPPNVNGDWKQTDVTTNNIDIVEDTEVFLSFLSEYGDNENKNLLGYYYYPTPGDGEVPPSAHSEVVKYILLPNVAAVETFASYNLLYVDENGYVSKTFPKGVTVGFYLMINPTATDAGHSADFNLMRWTQWSVYTNSIWNRANSNWRSNYARDNFFTSGDMSTSTSFANQIKGLAFYAAKDRAEENNNSWRMQAMHFVVATSNPEAMKTYNKGFINIGTGTLINNK